ncbi:MAG: hypothetical protein ABI175_18670 [Polyangiales bacterium]
MKAFFVAALQSALDLGIATPEDVLKHATPDLLAEHLPRPLWARLLTACVGAPKVDAQLVVETIGVSNLCEHVPAAAIWNCIAEIGARSLGGAIPVARPVVASGPKALTTSSAAGPVESTTASRTPAKPLSIGSPPPPTETKTPTPPPSKAIGTNIPAPGAAVPVDLDDVVAELDAESSSSPLPARARTPTGQRFRQTNTNIGRLAQANQQRRPQAQAAVSPPETPSARPRRGETEIEVEVETDVKSTDDWRTALAVEDEQLVDWSSSEETMTTTEGESQPRKR